MAHQLLHLLGARPPHTHTPILLALVLTGGLLMTDTATLPAAPAPTRTPAKTAAPRPKAPAPKPAPAPVVKEEEWWMGVYLGENKLGYVHVTTTPEGKGPRKNIRMRSSTWTRAAVFGYSLEQRIDVDELLSPDLRPITMNTRMGSAGKWIDVKARFLAESIEVERRVGDDATKKSIPIPKGANLVADAETALLRRSVRVGQTWRYSFLNVLTLTLEEATTKVVRRETIEVGGKRYATIVTEVSSPTISATSWLLPDGKPVKMTVSPGLTMVTETREQALAHLEARPYDPARDMATQTAVVTNGVVDAPGRARYLRLTISGIPERRFVLEDARQRARVVEEKAPFTVEYTIDTAAEAPAAPLTDAERKALLSADAYLQTDHPDIRARAVEATAGAEDDAAKVQALWKWVHENVRSQGDIGLPRSALEVLREPVGVCRDYATLYGALARAAGIPTRVCAGIVWFSGRFYYHAWAESHVAGRWVPVDATVAPGFVDASHVKFAQGDVSTMYGAVRVIGVLKAEIHEQK